MTATNNHRLARGGMAVLATTALCSLVQSSQAQFNTNFTTSSERIGDLVSEVEDSPSVPAQRQHVLGTDLGYVANWNSYNIILFGDSIPSVQSPPPQISADALHDDAWGYWYVPGSSMNTTPNLNFWTGFSSIPGATIHVLDEDGTDLNMSGARTPAGIGSFNGGGWWAVFARGGSAKICNRDSDCTGGCNSGEGCSGFICDSDLGLTPPILGGDTPGVPCHKDNSACADVTVGQGGLCRDASGNNSLRNFAPNQSATGYGGVYQLNNARQQQLVTVATTHQVGLNRSTDLTTYQTMPWLTNKFTNVAMRTSESVWNYQRPVGAPEMDDVLWMWGRPSYWSKTSKAGESALYLAAQTRAALPFVGSAGSDLRLAYRTTDGTWSLNQKDAAPLEAEDGWADGVAGHMSFAYLPGMNKWVMLYGGGVPVSFDFMGGPLPASLTAAQKTDGTIKMRLADVPWGPWSAPVDAVSPLDPDDGLCGEISDGGAWTWPVGWRDRCGGSQTPSQFFFRIPPVITGPGTLYGASIVESWSTSINSKNVDIGWFVSTWNPYEVHQMKTRITRP